MWSGEWDAVDAPTPTATDPPTAPSDTRTESGISESTLHGNGTVAVRRRSKLRKTPRPSTSQRLVKRRPGPSRASSRATAADDATMASSTVAQSTASPPHDEPGLGSRASSRRLRKRSDDSAAQPPRRDTQPSPTEPPLREAPTTPPAADQRRSDTDAATTIHESPLLPDRPHLEPSPPAPASPETSAIPPRSTSKPPLHERHPAFRSPPSDPTAPLPNDGAAEDTAHTTHHRVLRPAVVHETRRRAVHHVRHPELARTTHRHDVVHRVLPVVQYEKRDTRHFVVGADGALVEVAARDAPGASTLPGAEAARDDAEGPVLAEAAERTPRAPGVGMRAELGAHSPRSPLQERTHVHAPRLHAGAPPPPAPAPAPTPAAARDAPPATPAKDRPAPRPRMFEMSGALATPPSAAKAAERAEAPTLWPPARRPPKGNRGRVVGPRGPADVVWWQGAVGAGVA